MAQQIKIPVLKNKNLVVADKKKRRSVNRRMGISIFAIIAGILAFMLAFVWLKVQTNNTLAAINELQQALAQNAIENQKLAAEVERLKSLSNVQEMAQTKLGLKFLPREYIIKVTE